MTKPDPCRVYTCDQCRKPIESGDAVYGLAWNEDKCTGRHWDCHTPTEQIFADLRSSISRAEQLAKQLKEK